MENQPANSTLTWILTLISILLIIFGALGLVVIQKPLSQQSFDTRKLAAEIKTCNEACVNNAECQVNHFCYQGLCRLADNPGHENCQGVPDRGLNFECDHYCADSRECASDLVCLENRCRRADNPDSYTCQLSDAAIRRQIQENCNAVCQSHADCAVNMRCYGGVCRLASHPAQTKCQAQLVKVEPQPAAAPPTAPPKRLKGGWEATLSGQSPNQSSGQAATEAALPATPAAVIFQPSPSPEVQPNSAPTLPEEKTAWDTLVNSLRRAGMPVEMLSILALATGGILLLIVIIPKLITKLQNQKRQRPPTLDTQGLEQRVKAKDLKPPQQVDK